MKKPLNSSLETSSAPPELMSRRTILKGAALAGALVVIGSAPLAAAVASTPVGETHPSETDPDFWAGGF